ncbi:hypothetical protein G7048_06115 [Diaphorobacter sp. HDW4B]|uniref:hypothetical protein n=1 Tax=Diaphorobacter sp. HDW4B TaxID=2714925 RepID=UPI0014089418|nr:hypothetical protein [Diaphorobacter sp. HDW4B]QIL69969.1 hypothetical protein G7048_06115 [Diaphorobacter sp. HDW4B]
MTQKQHITFTGIPNGILSFQKFIEQSVTKSLITHAVDATDNPVGQISAILIFWQIAELKAKFCTEGFDVNDGTLDEGYIKLAYSFVTDNLAKILIAIGREQLSTLVDLLAQANADRVMSQE